MKKAKKSLLFSTHSNPSLLSGADAMLKKEKPESSNLIRSQRIYH